MALALGGNNMAGAGQASVGAGAGWRGVVPSATAPRQPSQPASLALSSLPTPERQGSWAGCH